MAHPLESEYVMLEAFTEAQPADGAEDAATVSSPDMERLNQEADVASTASAMLRTRNRQLQAGHEQGYACVIWMFTKGHRGHCNT